ncbi:phosphoserine phosphatase [Silvibacterium bohemicum]|uniref:Phosphoserine phosphatase n=1 Tax=Silvibacterium bohemicum TaxID=1577686 RepID=A0A841JNU2_9BACT|nr:haloacid dehalogenase-like hydrolase [Silvibacterium bohemicum]MBB6142820.1 phosphoserine phosphatase [Silvibacterium bohemicum]
MTTVHAAPARYTLPEFENSVLSLSPSIAVFDCDGTLWGGDAGYGFMIWSIETGLVSRNASDWIDSRYRQYLASEISEAEMCGEMVQIYAGLQESELRHAAAEYFRLHIESHIFPELRSLVARLHESGVQIWAVSSTNTWVIEEGVRRFNIPASRVLSARVRVDDGRITSDLVAVPTDEAKATALKQAGVTRPDAVFGNSVHDAAMLAIAQRAFPVNPTAALAEIAAQRNWTVFYPESVLTDSKL